MEYVFRFPGGRGGMKVENDTLLFLFLLELLVWKGWYGGGVLLFYY
jgi:hypothetical protein